MRTSFDIATIRAALILGGTWWVTQDGRESHVTHGNRIIQL